MVASLYFAAAASVIATSVRVFFTDGLDGGVRQATIDVSSGEVTGGTSFDVVFEAKVQSPIAAMETTDVSYIHICPRVLLLTSSQQGNVRVFALNSDNFIIEGSLDGSGSWYSGDLTSMQVQAAPFSDLATITWDDDQKLYYQADDLTIRELSRNGATGQWSSGIVIPTGITNGSGAIPFQGTSIAAIGWDAVNIRVYYQATDSTLWEASRNGTVWSSRQVVDTTTAKGQDSALQLGASITAVRQLDFRSSVSRR